MLSTFFFFLKGNNNQQLFICEGGCGCCRRKPVGWNTCCLCRLARWSQSIPKIFLSFLRWPSAHKDRYVQVGGKNHCLHCPCSNEKMTLPMEITNLVGWAMCYSFGDSKDFMVAFGTVSKETCFYLYFKLPGVKHRAYIQIKFNLLLISFSKIRPVSLASGSSGNNYLHVLRVTLLWHNISEVVQLD